MTSPGWSRTAPVRPVAPPRPARLRHDHRPPKHRFRRVFPTDPARAGSGSRRLGQVRRRRPPAQPRAHRLPGLQPARQPFPQRRPQRPRPVGVVPQPVHEPLIPKWMYTPHQHPPADQPHLRAARDGAACPQPAHVRQTPQRHHQPLLPTRGQQPRPRRRRPRPPQDQLHRDPAADIANNLITGFPSPTLEEAIETITSADGLTAVTPAFSASYSRPFKSFFDVIDNDALTAKPVLAAATGGTARHSLALEHALRPLFAYLRTDPSHPQRCTRSPRTGAATATPSPTRSPTGSCARPTSWPT